MAQLENKYFIDLEGLAYYNNKIDSKKADIESPAFTGTPTINGNAIAVKGDLAGNYDDTEIKKEISQLSESIGEVSKFVVTKTSHEGYLTKNGRFNDPTTSKCLITPKIKCNEGDVFVYSGRYGILAVAALFYGVNGDIVGYVEAPDKVRTVNNMEILIPENVYFVMFSSFDSDILEVYPKNSGSLNEMAKITADNAVSVDVALDNLAALNIRIQRVDNRYLGKESGIIVKHDGIISYISEYIYAKSGDTFLYSGNAEASTASAVFYDKNKKFVSANAYKDAENETIVCPEKTVYVRFASFKETKPLSVSKVTPFTNYGGIVGELYNAKDIAKANSSALERVFSNNFVNENAQELEFVQRETPYGSTWKDPQYAVYVSQMLPISSGLTVKVRANNFIRNIPRIAVFDVEQNLLYVENPSINGLTEDTYTINNAKAAYVVVQGYSSLTSTNPTKGWYLDIQPMNPYIKETINESINSAIGNLHDSNVLYGKTWYCCGDSFSEGDFNSSTSDYLFQDGKYKGLKKVYSRFIALRNNMNLQLLAKCGATCGMRKDDEQYNNPDFNPVSDVPSQTNNFFYGQLPKIGENPDYITLWFGINDSGRCELGTINDETVKTFYGALNWSMLYLLTNFPMAHIGLVVSNQCNATYKQAVREVGQKWAIPYLDMEGDISIPSVSGNRENQTIPVDTRVKQLKWNNVFRVSATNGHPNEKAHEYQSTFIENWLRSL